MATALQKGFFGSTRISKRFFEAGVSVANGDILELGLLAPGFSTRRKRDSRLHLKSLQVMLQFQVDRSFGRWQLDMVDMLRRGDIVDFRDILPDKDVEELLREIVSSAMPSGGMHFAESVELFRGRLFFCTGLLGLRGALCVILDTQMDAHEGRDTANGGEVVHRRCTG